MGDEAAVQREMLVEPIAEVLEVQSVFEKPHPGFQHERFIARAHELAVMENMIHKRQRTLLTGRCAGARRETLAIDDDDT